MLACCLSSIPKLGMSTLPNQFGNRLAVIHDRCRTAVEVLDQGLGVVDAQVMVDGRQEVAGPADPFDGVFAAFVGGADEASGGDPAAGPDVGKAARPVIAAGLHGAGRGAGVAGPGAGGVTDLGRAAEFAGHHDQHALVKSACVDVFDQRRDRLIVGWRPEFHGVEDMVIDGVVVPVLHPATQGAAQAGRQHIDAGFHQPPRQQQLLPPGIAAVAVAGPMVFATQVERFLRLRIRQQRHRL